MFNDRQKSQLSFLGGLALAAAMIAGTLLVAPPALHARDKKKNAAADEKEPPSVYKDRRAIWATMDISKIVWPNPPAVARIKFQTFWSGEKITEKKQEKKKSGWMERLAGVTTGETVDSKPKWQLVTPNGIAVDSQKRVYVADSKVRAIFIVNVDTGEYSMIKNGSDAKFQWLTALAIDDADQLFAADSGMRRVAVFDHQHKYVQAITERLLSPAGLAVDNENRFLYISDAEQDVVNVYDADPPYRYLRTIGKTGTKHTSTVPGEFAKPSGLAVDQDGNLYVADTWNNRIEIFDAEGNFIRAFGKAGDGPGYFARPKGVAIDSDGHLWVADGLQDRVQVFTPEGRLLIWMGEHGIMPGQFRSLANVAVDGKNNRVFTTEQLGGRLQVFQYVTNAEAKAEFERSGAAAKKKVEERRAATSASGEKSQATGEKKQ